MTPVSVLMPVRSLAAVPPVCWERLGTNRSLAQVVVSVDAPEEAAERGAAEALARTYPGWRWDVVFTGRRAGIAHALNLGIPRLAHELTARQDDDDPSDAGRLDRQAAHFESEPGLAVLGSQLRYEREGRRGLRAYPLAHDEILRRLPFENPFAHPTVMLRTALLRELGYRDVPYAEDWDLWIRALGRGVYRNLPEPLVTYVARSESALRSFPHGPVLRAQARLVWGARRVLAPDPSTRLALAASIAARAAASLLPEALYRVYYRRVLYP